MTKLIFPLLAVLLLHSPAFAGSRLFVEEITGLSIERPERWLFDHEFPPELKQKLGIATDLHTNNKDRSKTLLKQFMFFQGQAGSHPTMNIEYFSSKAFAAVTGMQVAEHMVKKIGAADPNFVVRETPRMVTVAGREAAFLEIEATSRPQAGLNLAPYTARTRAWFFKIGDGILKVSATAHIDEWPSAEKDITASIGSIKFPPAPPSPPTKNEEIMDGLKF